MSEVVKMLMLGEGGVGKSSLLRRYVEDRFSEDIQATLGVEFAQKRIRIGNHEVQMQIWDTAGQERFKTITPIYYKNVQAVSLVFSVTDRQSFQQVTNWMLDLKEQADVDQLGIVVVGNKTDVNQRAVSQEDGKQLAAQLGVQYFECSARTGQNVKEMFEAVTKQVIEKRKQKPPEGSKIVIDASHTEQKCC